MFAVFKSGGKQYKVAPNDVVKLEKLEGEAGTKVKFTEVLSVADGDKVEVGAPLVDKAVIEGEILEQRKAPKVLIFKKRRRKNSRRKNGHRQCETVVRVISINGKGAEKKAAPAKKEEKAAAPKAEKKTESKAAPKKAARKAEKKGE